MEVDAIYLGRIQFGQKPAERWYADLLRALDSLSTFPAVFPWRRRAICLAEACGR